MSKAREIERRGPSLLAAQEGRNLASEQTIQRVGERNAAMANEEYQITLDQERQALARQSAVEQAAAERQQEMDQRLSDFDSTVKQLGQMGAIDHDRLWASRTTAQKIAGFIELAVSGFRGAPSMVMKRIDDDVKAQEFAYYAARDAAQAKQTAFSLAMQKWNNADAARAAAKAAAIDVTQAQLAQVSAKWKGTESANRADMALAALQDEKMMQIQNGIQFVPSQPTGRRWVDPRTGLVYSEQEAKAMQAKLDEHAEARRMEGAKVGGQLLVEGARGATELEKAAMTREGKANEEAAKIASGVQAAKIPDLRALAERALSTQATSAPSFAEGVARAMQPSALEARTMSTAANEREQAWAAFKNEAIHALSGAAVSPSEMKRYESQFGAADTAEQRATAANDVLRRLEAQERAIKAGASKAGQTAYDQQYEQATGDRPTAPPSAKKGW